MTQATIQMTPGDDTHLTLLMAPQSLNFVTGQDREHLLAYGRAVFAAGQASKCPHQIAEPATAGTAVRTFRDYLGVHDGIKLGGQAMDDMALDLARIALDFKHLVEPQHPDDAAVDALAVLMKTKLAKQREKGYGGWDTDCTQQRLSDMLRAHVEKGDPVDVANFCAFLLARGEGIAAAPQAVQPAIMPKGESAAAQLRAMATNYPAGHSWDKLDARACIRGALEIEALRALLAAAPAHPAEGVPAFHVRARASIDPMLSFEVCDPSIAGAQPAYLAATQPAAQGLDALDAARYRSFLDGLKVGDKTICIYAMKDGFGTRLRTTAEIDAAIAAQAKQGGAS